MKFAGCGQHCCGNFASCRPDRSDRTFGRSKLSCLQVIDLASFVTGADGSVQPVQQAGIARDSDTIPRVPRNPGRGGRAGGSQGHLQVQPVLIRSRWCEWWPWTTWAGSSAGRSRWRIGTGGTVGSCNLTSTTWQVVEGAAQCKPRKYGFCAW